MPKICTCNDKTESRVQCNMNFVGKIIDRLSLNVLSYPWRTTFCFFLIFKNTRKKYISGY